jgi:hypothetical protein
LYSCLTTLIFSLLHYDVPMAVLSKISFEDVVRSYCYNKEIGRRGR